MAGRERDNKAPEPLEPEGPEGPEGPSKLAVVAPWLVVVMDLVIGLVSVAVMRNPADQQMTGFVAVLATALVLAFSYRGRPIVRERLGFDRAALWSLVLGMAGVLLTALMLPFPARANLLAAVAVALGVAGVFSAFRAAGRIFLDGGTAGSFAASRAGAMLCSLSIVLAVRVGATLAMVH